MKQQQVMTICILLVPLSLIGGYFLGSFTRIAAGQPDIEARFSPNGGTTETVVRVLRGAKQSIAVQAYSFTSRPIAQALIAAQRRGVDVTVVVDPNGFADKNSVASLLSNAGVAIFVDPEHAIAHNKIILIDATTIITGSFNFTNQAERANAENLLVIRNDPPLFAEYESHFRAHLAHSEPYQTGRPASRRRPEPSDSRRHEAATP